MYSNLLKSVIHFNIQQLHNPAHYSRTLQFCQVKTRQCSSLLTCPVQFRYGHIFSSKMNWLIQGNWRLVFATVSFRKEYQWVSLIQTGPYIHVDQVVLISYLIFKNLSELLETLQRWITQQSLLLRTNISIWLVILVWTISKVFLNFQWKQDA